MLSKIIVTGATRNDALSKARYILRQSKIEGLATTIPFHIWLLYFSPFSQELVDISFISREFDESSFLTDLDSLSEVSKDHNSYGEEYSSIELLEAFDQSTNQSRSVEVVHRVDGLFLARFFGEKDPKNAIISNTKQGAITNLVSISSLV